jgi:hypothetical protein
MLKLLKGLMGWLRKPVLPARAETIKICLVGPASAGKSALAVQFLNALGDGSAPRLAVKLLFNPSEDVASDESILVHHGSLELKGKQFRIELVDAKGSLLSARPPAPDTDITDWPPLYQATYDADLLILTLDPHLLDQRVPPKEVMTYLLSHVKLALTDNPEAMVAIVYSKADEYGIVDPQELRIISERKHLNALERLQSADAADVGRYWEAFVTAVTGPADEANKWAELRRTLLEETRLLWEGTAYQLQHRFINGYFVAAEPLDERYRPWTRRGVFQLFSDFFDHVQDTRAQPRFGNWSAAVMVLLALGGLLFGMASYREARSAVAEARGASLQYGEELKLWQTAAGTDAEPAYRGYLSSHPQGYFVSEAKQRLAWFEAKEAEDKAWAQAIGLGTVQALDGYVAAYPNGRHVPEARERLAQLRSAAEQAAWAAASAADSVEAYEEYLAEYPAGAHAAEARGHLERLRPRAASVRESYYLDLKRDWDEARRENSVAGYRRFVQMYPDSTLREAASVWIEKLTERQKWPSAPGQDPSVTEPWRRLVSGEAQTKAWAAVKTRDSIQAYREYLVAYFDGPHASEAVRRIKQLEALGGTPR